MEIPACPICKGKAEISYDSIISCEKCQLTASHDCWLELAKMMEDNLKMRKSLEVREENK